MLRKSGYPVANCNIKMPDGVPNEMTPCEDEGELQQRRQQLINFGHIQWGFNNWNWAVSKQELDFVDFANGKFSAGVVAFVSVTVKSFDIHRENIGYATSLSPSKGLAIYQARKCAVTNALRETLLSFGGTVAAELMEMLETYKIEHTNTSAPTEPLPENNQNAPNKPAEPKNSPLNKNIRKDSSDSGSSNHSSTRSSHPMPIKNVVANPRPPVAKAHPMPANLPPAANRHPLPANAPRPPPPPAPAAPPAPPAPPQLRPNSNDAGRPLEGIAEEEARAERKRRQRLAQEEFKQRQLAKERAELDEKQETQELHKNESSFDQLLLELPSQDVVIEATGGSGEGGKRKPPPPEWSAAKRRASVMSKLDIVQTE